MESEGVSFSNITINGFLCLMNFGILNPSHLRYLIANKLITEQSLAYNYKNDKIQDVVHGGGKKSKGRFKPDAEKKTPEVFQALIILDIKSCEFHARQATGDPQQVNKQLQQQIPQDTVNILSRLKKYWTSI